MRFKLFALLLLDDVEVLYFYVEKMHVRIKYYYDNYFQMQVHKEAVHEKRKGYFIWLKQGYLQIIYPLFFDHKLLQKYEFQYQYAISVPCPDCGMMLLQRSLHPHQLRMHKEHGAKLFRVFYLLILTWLMRTAKKRYLYYSRRKVFLVETCGLWQMR